MSNICAYPLLNFNPYYKSNSITTNCSIKEMKKRPNTQSKIKSENIFFNNDEDFKYSTHNNFYKQNDKFPQLDDDNYENISNDIQTLYINKIEMKYLGECEVKFYIENNM